jgi:hypothetical protein
VSGTNSNNWFVVGEGPSQEVYYCPLDADGELTSCQKAAFGERATDYPRQ